LIEVEDVIVFIDNMMVEMEIEEVLRRIAENNLFVKPESVKSV